MADESIARIKEMIASRLKRDGFSAESLRDGDEAHEAEEIADALIRLLDYAAWRGFSIERELWAKMGKNRGRPYLHGRAAF